ncbi:MAG: hypothetical protein U0791_12220 [Gemmataceae bacterium]
MKPAAIRLVLAKTDSTCAFLDAVEKGTLRFDLLALRSPHGPLASHAYLEAAERRRSSSPSAADWPNADRQEGDRGTEADPDRWRRRRRQRQEDDDAATARKRHQHSGEGTAIGLDLTGMAVHPKEELLIHIIDLEPQRGGHPGGVPRGDAGRPHDHRHSGATTGTSVEIIDGEVSRHACEGRHRLAQGDGQVADVPEG